MLLKNTYFKKANQHLLKVLVTESIRHQENLNSEETRSAEHLARQVQCHDGDMSLFIARIHKRAQLIDQNLDPSHSSAIKTLFARYNMLCTLLTLIVFILGLQTVSLLLSDTHINILSLLIPILLPNLISLIISLCLVLKTYFDTTTAQSLPLNSLIFYLQKKFSISHNAALKAWYDIFTHSRFGQFKIFSLSNRLWCVYIIGMLCSLVWALSFKQFTFTWETTILSKEWFSIITHAIITPISFFSEHSLTYSEILSSHITPDYDHSMLSKKWAQVLLLSTLFYAFAPRFIFWIITTATLYRAQKALTININHIAYSHLYVTLMLNKNESSIIDLDTLSDTQYHATRHDDVTRVKTFSLPRHSALMSFELPVKLKQLVEQNSHYVMAIDGLTSQRKALKFICENSDTPIYITCSLIRSPDRGLKRFFSDCVSHYKELNIILIVSNLEHSRYDDTMMSSRTVNWLQCADSVGIDHSNIHIVSHDSTRHSDIFSE
jgi:hypothetical protein